MSRIADYDLVKRVLKFGRPTEINRATGISRNSIYRYKNGVGSVDNMPLADAIKLTDYGKEIGL